MQATLTTAEITLLKLLRDQDEQARKTIKANLFAKVKARFGIPQEHKLKVEIDNISDPMLGVLIRKNNGTAYDLDGSGQWVGAAPAAQVPAMGWVKVHGLHTTLVDEAFDVASADDVVLDHEVEYLYGNDKVRLDTANDCAYVFMATDLL